MCPEFLWRQSRGRDMKKVFFIFYMISVLGYSMTAWWWATQTFKNWIMPSNARNSWAKEHQKIGFWIDLVQRTQFLWLPSYYCIVAFLYLLHPIILILECFWEITNLHYALWYLLSMDSIISNVMGQGKKRMGNKTRRKASNWIAF